MTQTLLSLGHGYSARALTRRLLPQGWEVIGTTRDPAKLESLRATGITPILWDKDAIEDALPRATHVLISASPDDDGDPALRLARDAIATRAPHLDWAGYLSTTGVYGDADGAWIDETAPLAPSGARGAARVDAEAAWADIPGLPLHIFRLAGIYGPGRGPFAKVRAGRAQRIVKPGQVFSRIHVEDIARALHASIESPDPGAVYNLCDDEPAPPQDVIAHAAELLGLPVPPEVPFDEAEMSDMARSFYADNKRVSNAKIKADLGLTLAYPSYREGLAALLEDGA
ncbi:Nucleoside-diphosphate-sugar epimerase [Roseivivax lentus]|uniref:Nucleoside-diphosphate-sugar epimerase n=1 Tax=Roseivivax lentus TaxID=633194 RepID=A0A1N7K0V0_9RHOB|nr:SDR family oxidoreductase [Roseivivax lentus]SIS55212.1 Nucleoside-diphosphate-sugar epimerase [Roseivivax lentus]